jgi:hypothetical protein
MYAPVGQAAVPALARHVAWTVFAASAATPPIDYGPHPLKSSHSDNQEASAEPLGPCK